MYQQINIFKRNSDSLFIYRCFKCLSSNQYYVQSKDTVTFPLSKETLNYLDSQTYELFFDDDIAARTESFSTIEAAIKEFEVDFL